MRTHFFRYRISLAGALCLIGLLLGVSSCDETEYRAPILGAAAGGGTIGGGEAQRITLLVTPSNGIDTTADAFDVKIGAKIEFDNGQPVPEGTTVMWTATVGTLDEIATDTAAGGWANVTLTLPQGFQGCSYVTANAGDASKGVSVCTSTVVVSSPKTLVVTADDTKIAPNGTTEITARLTINGQPAAGVQVNFAADGDAAHLSQNTAVTNANGEASVELIGNNADEGGLVTVEATATDYPDGSISILVGDTAKTLVVTADDTKIAPNGTTEITARLTINGQPAAGVQVNFAADGDAAHLSQNTAVTNANGEASVELIGDNADEGGTVTVEATATDYPDGSISILVGNSVKMLVVTATRTRIRQNSFTDITAQLTINGTAAAGVQVNFVIDSGDTFARLNPNAAITDAGGVAKVQLIGLNNLAPTDDDEIVTIKATAEGYPDGTISVLIIP